MGRNKASNVFAQNARKSVMVEYDFHFSKFEQIIRSIFEWKNMPESISLNFIEKTLFYDGMCVFFKRPKTGVFQVAKCTRTNYNAYGEPTSFHTIDWTGESFDVTAQNAVPIYNNVLFQPSAPVVGYFADRLAEVDKTMRVNLNALKCPVVVAVQESQKLSAREFMSKVKNGQMVIPVDKNFFNECEIQTFDLKAQNHCPDLQLLKRDINNECLTYFSIDNVNVLKKERLVSDEATQNNQERAYNETAMMKPRKEACKKINEMFGLNIDVTISQSVIDMLEKEATQCPTTQSQSTN